MPAAVIPNIAISVFFLFVFNSGLSSVANLPGFKGSYLAFIIPVSIVSASVGGAGTAGQSLVRDIESGYFTKLLLTPSSRLALVWGPMVAGGRPAGGAGGAHPRAGSGARAQIGDGPGGLFVVLFFAFLWGMAFAGYAVAVALKTKNAAAAQAATFAFFPLIFLSTTFVPKEYIGATWLKWAATINPTTYIYDAMRSLLIDGWRAQPAAHRGRRHAGLRDAHRHPGSPPGPAGDPVGVATMTTARPCRRQPFRIAAVLFDFDGTLTVPEALDFAAIRARGRLPAGHGAAGVPRRDSRRRGAAGQGSRPGGHGGRGGRADPGERGGGRAGAVSPPAAGCRWASSPATPGSRWTAPSPSCPASTRRTSA